MFQNRTRNLALNALVSAIGWMGVVYTFMQIVAGKLSGPPLLDLVLGGAVYGLGLFAVRARSQSARDP